MCTKRIIIAIVVATLFGLFCAYGTTKAQIPGLIITPWVLAGVVYNRALIGFVIGLSGHVKLLKAKKHKKWNPIVRGALMGVIVSIAIGINGGISGIITLSGFGLVYGIITDFVATKYGGN